MVEGHGGRWCSVSRPGRKRVEQVVLLSPAVKRRWGAALRSGAEERNQFDPGNAAPPVNPSGKSGNALPGSDRQALAAQPCPVPESAKHRLATETGADPGRDRADARGDVQGMGRFDDPTAFAAVMRAGGFSRSAARLGVGWSALSQTIRAREQRLSL